MESFEGAFLFPLFPSPGDITTVGYDRVFLVQRIILTVDHDRTLLAQVILTTVGHDGKLRGNRSCSLLCSFQVLSPQFDQDRTFLHTLSPRCACVPRVDKDRVCPNVLSPGDSTIATNYKIRVTNASLLG